jgi:hypothetical protein
MARQVNADRTVNAEIAGNVGNAADPSSFPAIPALSLLLRPGDVTLPGPQCLRR